MRVLSSATGKVTHLDRRERSWTDANGVEHATQTEGPVCNGAGAGRGTVRWYDRNAKAVTCKRCLAWLDRLHTEALAEDEHRTAQAEVEAEPATETAGPIDRDSVLDSGAREPVTDSRRPARANTVFLYDQEGTALRVLGSGTGEGRPGVWVMREGRSPLQTFLEREDLERAVSAHRPGERARLADAARVSTSLATPDQVANLATVIAQQAELYAAGGVTGAGVLEFRARMERNVHKLARYLGMSEPVKLSSLASPYGGPLLCRLASSRWTTYGATCNAPLNTDGTCPDAHAHV